MLNPETILSETLKRRRERNKTKIKGKGHTFFAEQEASDAIGSLLHKLEKKEIGMEAETIAGKLIMRMIPS